MGVVEGGGVWSGEGCEWISGGDETNTEPSMCITALPYKPQWCVTGCLEDWSESWA